MATLGAHYKVNQDQGRTNDKLVFRGEKYRISVLSDCLVRLEYDEGGKFENRLTELVSNRNFPVFDFKVQEDNNYLVIETKYFKLQYVKNKPFVGPKYAPDTNLRINLLGTENEWYFGHPEPRNLYTMVGNLDHKEKFSRYGSQKLNVKEVKNKVKELVTKEKGLFSIDGFASIDDAKSLIFIDDGSLVKDERVRLDTYVFMYGNNFGECLRDYFRLTGTPPLVPRYALGVWWNKNSAYNFNDTKQLLIDFNKYKIPCSVLLLSDKWHIKDKNNPKRFKSGFTFNKDYYYDPKEYVTYLHERGVRLGLNIDPSEGIHPHEERFNDFAKNMGITDKQIIPFNVYDKNYVANYFYYFIRPLHEIGVDFYWIDYYTEDEQTLRALNYYHFNDYIQYKGQRGLILSRNAGKAMHKYPVLYSGETLVSWKTLNDLPYFNNTAANMGISWWSHDIGGFEGGIEDSELYLRYVQLGTYSPIFRFASKDGHYYKREPWNWDVKTLSIVREYTTLRHRLVPYLYTEGFKYSKYALPIIQPLYYKTPGIYDEVEYKNEYYFGSELLVAPITVPKDKVMNRSVERIYIPAGTWYDFKTGKKFLGDKRYVIFYKDEDYPVFAKKGTIIPMADLEENINVTNPPRAMELQVFPGESNVYDLYEDDGYSSLYEDGYYIITRIEYNYLANNYTLIIRPLEGKSGIIPDLRDYRIRFRNTRAAENVKDYIGGEETVCESYVEDNDFVVCVSDVPTTKQLTVNCKGKDIEIDAERIINDDIDSIINDLPIKTTLKEKIAEIIFSDTDIGRKRILIKKLKKEGLSSLFIRMFMKLLEFSDIK